jgi:hypothetical protein
MAVPPGLVVTAVPAIASKTLLSIPQPVNTVIDALQIMKTHPMASRRP